VSIKGTKTAELMAVAGALFNLEEVSDEIAKHARTLYIRY